MRINSATGSSTKVVKEVDMLRIICSKPLVPPKKTYTPTTLIIMKEKAMGIPVTMRIIRTPKMIRSSHSHPMEVASSPPR
jgi:hypothetical protein